MGKFRNLAEIYFVEGKGGYRLTSADAKNLFPNLRSSLPALKAAFYCLEFYEKLVLEGEKDLKLWDLLNRSLAFLDQNSGLPTGNLENFFGLFEKEFISISGYGVSEESHIATLTRDLNVKVIARPTF